MAFNARTFHMVLIVLMTAATVFTFDALRNGFWGNMTLGCLAFVILFILALTVFPVNLSADTDSIQVPAVQLHGFHALLDQLPIPIVSCAKEAAPQALNRAARSLFETDDIILSDGYELASAINLAFSGSRPTLEVQARRYAVSVSEFFGDSGELRLGILMDVEMEIHKAEASALKDTLHILSHEIMNSLTPVASLTHLVDSYLVEGSSNSIQAAREVLEMLSRRASSLTRFIEAYRAIARLPEPILQSVDPNRLMQATLDLFRRDPTASDVEFRLVFDENLPDLSIDEPQVSQALINVLTNAIEAVQASPGPQRVSVSVRRSHQDLIFAISDNGTGVPENIKNSLFTAFATTKQRGAGVGLNLARQIALAHGGNLQLLCDGSDGETTFAFRFPIY